MPQLQAIHRQYLLDQFYPNHFSASDKLTKYWVATSSDDIYDTNTISDSGWSMIELPFQSSNIWLGNRLLLFHTTQNLLVLNRFVALKMMNSLKIFEEPVDNSSQPCPFYVIDIQKVVNIAFEVSESNSDLKCYDIHRIACDSSTIYIEMTNGVLIVVATDNPSLRVDGRFIKDRIKIMETSGQSTKVVIYTEGHKLYIDNNTVPMDQIKSPIKSISASPVSVAIVTEDNEFLINGDDSNGTCGGVQTGHTEFKRALIQFPNEKIAEVRCGYIHTVVLLENGRVFASGYNDLKQCAREGSVREFTEIEEAYYTHGHIKTLRCTSRGTVLVTDSCAAFIGEVVHKFKEYQNRVLLEPFTQEFNEVAAGGWQYVLYNRVTKSTKSLNYFLNNLNQFSRGGFNTFNDCKFINL